MLMKCRSGLADSHRALRNSRAAASSAVIRSNGRIAREKLNPVYRNSKLFGGHLAHGYCKAGADIHAACEQGDGTIGMNGEKAIDELGIREFVTSGTGARASLRRNAIRQRGTQRETDNDRASGPKKSASGY